MAVHMGKKSRRPRTQPLPALPSRTKVSVCTPTFNRRPFLEGLVAAYKAQTYDHSLMEWVVVDDGSDCVRDVFEGVSGVVYVRVEEKMTLGQKRNLMHTKCSGDVIVYMDDDDYYPPTRVEHAVDTLRANPTALCAGASVLHTYFPTRKELWTFGPYGKQHCTAATMAFRRALLTRTSYDPEAALAEEKHFLKNYTIPLVQLDPMKTIAVISHAHSTFNKEDLLKDGPSAYVRLADTSVQALIPGDEARQFYCETVHVALADYPAGAPSNKPDVQSQFAAMKKEREERAEAQKQKRPGYTGTGVAIDDNGKRRELTAGEVLQTLQDQGRAIEALKARVEARDALIANLRAQIAEQEHEQASAS